METGGLLRSAGEVAREAGEFFPQPGEIAGEDEFAEPPHGGGRGGFRFVAFAEKAHVHLGIAQHEAGICEQRCAADFLHDHRLRQIAERPRADRPPLPVPGRFLPAVGAHIARLHLRVNRGEIASRGHGFVAAIHDLHAWLQVRGQTLRRPVRGAHGHAIFPRKELRERGQKIRAARLKLGGDLADFRLQRHEGLAHGFWERAEEHGDLLLA